ncbi:MAG: hypothetical protein K8R53_16320, partial [Bacteroidales bacterium]|nr:hypothetical protein [Bacteroidales bacterium]
MKTKKVLNQFANLVLLITLTLSLMYSCNAQQKESVVIQAYDLRINGHADSAQILLQQFTTENPENAQAWYELCRTTQQLGKSNPRKIKESLDEAYRCINKAVEIEPNNALYLSYKGKTETLQFYIGLQMGDENAAAYLEKFEETFNSVYQLDPSYTEDKLTLVEFFGGLPPNMGGNTEKAEKYAAELEASAVIAGAKARELLMPEDADYVAFWAEIVDENPENADALQALGRVYLFMEDIDSGKKYYQQAIDLDPSKNALYLDLGRYYMMGAMRDPEVLDSVAPMIEEQFNRYLNSKPEPIGPMKAWAYNTLAMINSRLGNQEEADKYKEMATELDPF